MKGEQLVIPEVLELPNYWVEIVEHGVFPPGMRFLVVEVYEDGWLRCWHNGIFRESWSNGTLLKPEHVRRVNV